MLNMLDLDIIDLDLQVTPITYGLIVEDIYEENSNFIYTLGNYSIYFYYIDEICDLIILNIYYLYQMFI